MGLNKPLNQFHVRALNNGEDDFNRALSTMTVNNGNADAAVMKSSYQSAGIFFSNDAQHLFS